MSNAPSQVLITGELENVPPALRPWFDPAQPLPADVTFFEEQETPGGITRKLLMGVGLIVIGALLVVFGLLLIVLPLVGLVFIFGGIVLLNSVRAERKALAAQQGGAHLRYGVFLSPAMLAVRTVLDYTFIPKGADVQVTNGKLYYTLHGDQKNLQLPGALVGQTPAALANAIQQWLSKPA